MKYHSRRIENLNRTARTIAKKQAKIMNIKKISLIKKNSIKTNKNKIDDKINTKNKQKINLIDKGFESTVLQSFHNKKF